MEMSQLLPWGIVAVITIWSIWKLGLKVKLPQELGKLIRDQRVVAIVQGAIVKANELKSLKSDQERREYALKLLKVALGREMQIYLPNWLANLLLEYIYAQIRKSLGK